MQLKTKRLEELAQEIKNSRKAKEQQKDDKGKQVVAADGDSQSNNLQSNTDNNRTDTDRVRRAQEALDEM